MIVSLTQDDIALVLGRQMLARMAAEKRITALEAQLAAGSRDSRQPQANGAPAAGAAHATSQLEGCTGDIS